MRSPWVRKISKHWIAAMAEGKEERREVLQRLRHLYADETLEKDALDDLLMVVPHLDYDTSEHALGKATGLDHAVLYAEFHRAVRVFGDSLIHTHRVESIQSIETGLRESVVPQLFIYFLVLLHANIRYPDNLKFLLQRFFFGDEDPWLEEETE